MGVKISQLPVAQQLASDDYVAILDTSEDMLKRTALSNLGGKGVRASYDETVALYSHAVGDIVYVNNTLYVVTSAISVGTTIAVGVNVSTDTDITENEQIYIENLPGSGGGGGSVDVDLVFDSTSENPLANMTITNALGPSEASSTATAAHAANSIFIFEGALVKALAAIAVNDTIAMGVNVSSITISAALSELNTNIANLSSTKQDSTDNSLTTTAKTVVGAINELKANYDVVVQVSNLASVEI